jgi:hypothetical protein
LLRPAILVSLHSKSTLGSSCWPILAYRPHLSPIPFFRFNQNHRGRGMALRRIRTDSPSRKYAPKATTRARLPTPPPTSHEAVGMTSGPCARAHDSREPKGVHKQRDEGAEYVPRFVSSSKPFRSTPAPPSTLRTKTELEDTLQDTDFTALTPLV